jgi:hypothetical protein
VQAFLCLGQDTTRNPLPVKPQPSLKADTIVPRPDSLPQRLQVAIFTPLYLDSAFDITDTYRYGKNFPRFINPGLEFYEGAQLAIDSLEKEGASLDFHIYDTRSVTKSLTTILKDTTFAATDLIIGHVSAYEARLLADAAARLEVPFINANFPNDAGVTKNPNYVLLNSTLFTHIQALYKFLQRNFSLSPITVFMKSKGPLEDLFKDYISTIEKSTSSVPLKLKYVTLNATFTEKDVIPHLDSNTTNIIISATLDTQFGQILTETLSELSVSYASTIFGMPTWDVLDFTKPQFKNLEIYYGTPFYISPTHKTAIDVTNHFRNRFYSRPTDMVFRGFDVVYHFTKVMLNKVAARQYAFTDRNFRLFTDYDIQPVTDPQNQVNYFENKKIYFVKKVDGVVKAVY